MKAIALKHSRAYVFFACAAAAAALSVLDRGLQAQDQKPETKKPPTPAAFDPQARLSLETEGSWTAEYFPHRPKSAARRGSVVFVEGGLYKPASLVAENGVVTAWNRAGFAVWAVVPKSAADANSAGLADALRAIAAHTNSKKLNYLGYSLGGLALRRALASGNAPAAAAIVYMAVPFEPRPGIGLGQPALQASAEAAAICARTILGANCGPWLALLGHPGNWRPNAPARAVSGLAALADGAATAIAPTLYVAGRADDLAGTETIFPTFNRARLAATPGAPARFFVAGRMNFLKRNYSHADFAHSETLAGDLIPLLRRWFPDGQ